MIFRILSCRTGWRLVPLTEIGNTERWLVLREDHEFSLTYADSEVSLKHPRENVKFVQEPDLDSKTSRSFQYAPTAIALRSLAL